MSIAEHRYSAQTSVTMGLVSHVRYKSRSPVIIPSFIGWLYNHADSGLLQTGRWIALPGNGEPADKECSVDPVRSTFRLTVTQYKSNAYPNQTLYLTSTLYNLERRPNY
jgi:hypothetical protein